MFPLTEKHENKHWVLLNRWSPWALRGDKPFITPQTMKGDTAPLSMDDVRVGPVNVASSGKAKRGPAESDFNGNELVL